MSISTPFLIGSGSGDAVVARLSGELLAEVLAEADTTDPASWLPPRLAAAAAVTDDFRNSRRDGERICTPPQGQPVSAARFSAACSDRFLDPKLPWTSTLLPSSPRGPCRRRCEPGCRRERIPRPWRLDYEN